MSALLTEVWNKNVWNKPLRLLVLAVVLTPLGGFIVSPVFAGRAAQVYAQRTGRKHPDALGVAVAVIWYGMFFAPLVIWYWFLRDVGGSNTP